MKIKLSNVKKVSLMVLLLFAITLTAIGCGGSQNAADNKQQAVDNNQQAKTSAEPIIIGLVAPLTGGLASTGAYMTNGIQEAVDEWNQKGTIGRPVKLVVEDNASQPSSSVNAYNKVLNSKPVAVFGPNTTVHFLPIEPFVKKSGVIMFHGTQTPSLSDLGNPWLIRIRVRQDAINSLVSSWVVNDLKETKIAALAINGDWGSSTVEDLKKNFEAKGIKLVAVERYNQDDKDFTAQLTNIKKSGAEIIMGIGYPVDAGLILQQISRLGLNAKVIGLGGYCQPDALKIAGSAAEGHYYVADGQVMDFTAVDNNDVIKTWAAKYQDKYNSLPTLISASYYDAANILLQAIASVGTDEQKLRDAIISVKDYNGMYGKYSFDSKGDGVTDTTIGQLTNGKMVLVKSLRK